jgi:hypothetical protein
MRKSRGEGKQVKKEHSSSEDLSKDKTEFKEKEQAMCDSNKISKDSNRKGEKVRSDYYFIAIVFLMLICAFLIGFFYVRQKTLSAYQYYYNNYKFVRYGNFWNLTLKNGYFEEQWVLRYSPRELLDIPVIGNMSDVFKSKDYVYITFNPFDEELSYVALAAGDLSIGLSRFLNKKPIAACTQQDDQGCLSVKIVNCSSEEYKEEPIIFLNHKSPTMLIFEDNCVIVQGYGFELLRSVDLLMLKYYGVMK